jgi:hypothetical protein
LGSVSRALRFMDVRFHVLRVGNMLADETNLATASHQSIRYYSRIGTFPVHVFLAFCAGCKSQVT